jgi:hypothetical protein
MCEKKRLSNAGKNYLESMLQFSIEKNENLVSYIFEQTYKKLFSGYSISFPSQRFKGP